MAEPHSDDKGERIAKRMSRAGVASRRQAEAMIAEGRVTVNGRRIDSPALNVRPGDVVAVDGRPLPEAEPVRLWRYHKPAGLITTARDQRDRPTVFASLPPDLPRVMSVGRLDLASEGLLLLTNDGALKSRLESPATGWLRRYRVRAHGKADDTALEPLRRGITVDGERFRPMNVTLDRVQGSNLWLTVGLREGRYREVRRALAEVGLTVNRLIRLSYGPFQLGDLAPGAVEEVKPRVLRDQLGLPADSDAGSRETTRPRRASRAGTGGAGGRTGSGRRG
jgi:23S rRNA pseudouridine2605 synthase